MNFFCPTGISSSLLDYLHKAVSYTETCNATGKVEDTNEGTMKGLGLQNESDPNTCTKQLKNRRKGGATNQW